MTQLRLAELAAGLSVISDLGKGLVDGQGLRACVVATDLAARLGLAHEDQVAVYWVGLLRFVGCTATASEMAAALGNELAVSAAFATVDAHDLRDVLRRTVTVVGARPGRILTFLARAPGVVREHEVASCEVAQAVATQLGLPVEVIEALGQVFERWDGRGNPGRTGGKALQPAARVWQVAHLADLVAEQAGPARPWRPSCAAGPAARWTRTSPGPWRTTPPRCWPPGPTWATSMPCWPPNRSRTGSWPATSWIRCWSSSVCWPT